MGKATRDLRTEHDATLKVLRILDKMLITVGMDDTVKLRYYGEIVDFLQIFVDKCHHGKEEKFLFAELENRGVKNEGGPIGDLLDEHDQGRRYIASMAAAVESKDLEGFETAAGGYRDLMRRHIEKENNSLFETADKLMGEAEQEELFIKFEQHEESVIGHGIHEKLHSMIHRWSEDFDVE